MDGRMSRMNWQRLADQVIARRVELGYRTREAFAEASGLSHRTMTYIERYDKASYNPATLAALEQALRWLPGSVAAILAGGDPTPAPNPAPVLPPAFARLLTVWRGLQPEQRAELERLTTFVAEWGEARVDPGTTPR